MPGLRHFARIPSKSSSHREHSLTVREAIRAYPAAMFWSFAVSMCIIMEGYDAILIVNFFAFPQFQRKCELHTSAVRCNTAKVLTHIFPRRRLCRNFRTDSDWLSGISSMDGSSRKCFRLWRVPWDIPQRLPRRHIWAEASPPGCSGPSLLLHLSHILRSEHSDFTHRAATVRIPLGGLCYDCTCVFKRDFAHVSSSIWHLVG